MRIDILTLFPQLFQGPFQESILKRAIESGLLKIYLHNIRDYTTDRHRSVDDYPYGGGAGMVMKPEPIFATVEAILAVEERDAPIILLSPQGRLFTQRVAQELASQPRLILLCGHYEGVDERIREHLATEELSIGDYVLTGGEIAALVIVDAVARCLPGVLGSAESLREDSHVKGLLEYPQYTRPQVFRGWAVPEVLLSGNHARIAQWRREQSILRTLRQRPDLLEKAELSPSDRELVRRARES